MTPSAFAKLQPNCSQAGILPRNLRKAHLIGACGAGMKAIAEVLLDAGWQLTGSDANPDPESLRLLTNRGMTISTGNPSELQETTIDLVIYSAAIPEQNAEREHAVRQNIPQFSYTKVLAEIFNARHGIAVCGTHGKSSTTALAAHLLSFANQTPPSFVCGAQRVFDNRNSKLEDSDLIIAEACEFRQHFLNLKPQTICLLGIDEDHFDCYPTIEDSVATYKKFIRQLPTGGKLIVNMDCRHSLQVSTETHADVIRFSRVNRHVEWFGERCGTKTSIAQQGEKFLEVEFRQPGGHALSNLLAAVAVAELYDRNASEIAASIASFQGLRRRFEIKSKTEQRVVIDDYAHHPTELRATLSAVREQFPNTRIVCVYQPHQILRTTRLLSEFSEALSMADEVAILPIYAARERDSDVKIQVALQLVEQVSQLGTKCTFLPSLDHVRSRLETTGKTQEVFLTIGAGDLTRIHNDRT